MSMDILYKNMAHPLNEFFGDFSCYQLPKISMDILYMNEFFGDSPGYLLLKMSWTFFKRITQLTFCNRTEMFTNFHDFHQLNFYLYSIHKGLAKKNLIFQNLRCHLQGNGLACREPQSHLQKVNIS